MQKVVGKKQMVRRVWSAGDENGILVTRWSDALDDVALNNNIGERRIVGLLAGVKPNRSPFIAPDPVRVTMTEVRDDVVGNDRAAIGVLGMSGSTGHQSNGPQAVASKLVSGDQHIPRPMHRFHTDKGIGDNVIRHNHMIRMQINSLRRVFDVVGDDPRVITDLRRGDDDSWIPVASFRCSRRPRPADS